MVKFIDNIRRSLVSKLLILVFFSLAPYYVPLFPGNPAAGVTSLLVSPGKGVLE